MKITIFSAFLVLIASAAEASQLEFACRFESPKGSHCEMHAAVCIPRAPVCDPDQQPPPATLDCRNFMEVTCGGYGEIYKDGLALAPGHERLILQGITSSRNPYPPSVFVSKDFDGLAKSTEQKTADAVLNFRGLEFEGHCAIHQSSGDVTQ